MKKAHWFLLFLLFSVNVSAQQYEINNSERARALANGAMPTKMEQWGELMNQAQYGAYWDAAQKQIQGMQINQLMADPQTRRDIEYGVTQLRLSMDDAVNRALQRGAERYGYSALATRFMSQQSNASQQSRPMANEEQALRQMTADVIPNYDQFIRSARWQNFLNTYVPNGNGIKYRDVVAGYLSRGDWVGIAQTMRAVAQRR